MIETEAHLKESFDLSARQRPFKLKGHDDKKIFKALSHRFYREVHNTFKILADLVPAISYYSADYPIGPDISTDEIIEFYLSEDQVLFIQDMVPIREQMEQFLRLLADNDPERSMRIDIRGYDDQFDLRFNPRSLVNVLDMTLHENLIENKKNFGSLYAAQHLLDRMETYVPAKDLN